MNSTLSCFSSRYRARKKQWKSIEIAGVCAEILHGTISQSSLPTPVAGTQCTACVMTALSLSAIKSVKSWSYETVDNIIRIATRRNEECDDKDERGFADIGSFLAYTQIPGYEGSVRLKEQLSCNGSMSHHRAKSLEIPPAVDILSDFTSRNWKSVVTLNDFSVGMIVEGHDCFLFNPHPCDDMGRPSSDGFGCVVKISTENAPVAFEAITSANYGPQLFSEVNIQSQVYCIVGLSVEKTCFEASGSMTDSPFSGMAPSKVLDSDDSESYFDLGKSKYPQKVASGGDADKTNKFDKVRGGFHVYKIASLPRKYLQLTDWFQKLDVNLISTECASSFVIKNNLIVVYSAKAMQSSDDYYWRKDGFSWTSGPHMELPRINPKFKITYHYIRTDIEGASWKRTEVSPLVLKDDKYDWDGLRRHKWPFILVHYKGQGNLQEVQCLPHGNRKYTPQKRSSRTAMELITNTPATPEFEPEYKLPPNEPKSKLLRGELRRKLQFTDTPYQTFALKRAECETMDPVSAKLMNPRNVNQVKSVKAAMKKDSSFADPVQLLVHHSILHKDLLPIYAREHGFLNAVAVLPQLDSHFQELIATEKKIIFHYDSTFNCGDFYVSILAFRHQLLESNPVIPLRFLFHENKSSFGHDLLFKNLVKCFPGLKNSEVVLVTDREAAFKNLKRRYIPTAAHIFCHLHIYRNAEEWCKSHGKSTKAKQYCDDIRQLLHSSTNAIFQELLESFTDNWSATFVQYFTSRLCQDVQMSSKFSVKNLIDFDSQSGVTNNASEAANAAYKQWLCGRKSMYEAVLRAYFYQIAKYGDIKDAFSLKDGKFKVNRQKLLPVFVFESVADTVSELGLLSIFNEGKFSNNVTKFKPKNVEIKSTTGLAWWFIRNQRIAYIDQDCFVKGLNRRSYYVDASRKFCTCLQSSCSHLQAILIQQRRTATKANINSNLNKVSHVYCPLKRAGKKLSDKSRKRGRVTIQAEKKLQLVKTARLMACKKMKVPVSSLSENVIELVQDVNSNNNEEHHKTTESSDVKKQPHVDSQENLEIAGPLVPTEANNIDELLANMPASVSLYKMTQLPLLSARNAQEVVLKIQTHALALWDLKTLDEDIKRSEEAAIKKFSKGFQRGYISNAVINAFIARLVNKNIALVPSNYASLAAVNSTSKITEAVVKTWTHTSWDSFNLILLPFERPTGFWNLGVIQVTAEGVVIYTIDPRNPLKTDETLARNFHCFFTTLGPKISEEFQVRIPKWKLPTDMNPSCSGALICMYALCFAREISISESMSACDMRNFILSSICGHCVIKSKQERLYCYVCGGKCTENAVSCDNCRQWVHYSCLGTPVDMSFSAESYACGDYQAKSP